MNKKMNIIMIGAMYENGGNTTHRFLDGHPELSVYPFESQLGTRLVSDKMSSLFPVKYRWPVFDLEATPSNDYKEIIDEEGKVRSRTPNVSKFRHMKFEMSDEERCEIYQQIISKSGRSRANNVAAFFQATFEAWKDYNRTGKETHYVGYSPVLTVDADKFLRDFPNGHFIHVVRNPWSAYADTKKRPVPLSLDNYMLNWTINQYYAIMFEKLYPNNFHIVRTDEMLRDPVNILGQICKKIGLQAWEGLSQISWNGHALEEVYPWGTIRIPTIESNKITALELSPSEIEGIHLRAGPYLNLLGFDKLHEEFFSPLPA